MGNKLILLCLILTLLVLPSVMAKQGHMVLLAVKESGDDYIGSYADLYLEIKPGQGRVFIDTYPLSKIDTQISTRFAKDIACSYLDAYCDQYDFFYTIRAKSSIIGGPSAGGAITVLTAAMLQDIPVSENIAMTGTINSGGLIGPVSGLKAKIDAAAEANITKVIIPSGERYVKEKGNLTLDLAEYGKKYKIEVVEAADLSDALFEFTGSRIKEINENLIIDEGYAKVMSRLADELCSRGEELQKEVAGFKGDKDKIDKNFMEKEEVAVNLSAKGKDALDDGRYYTAASRCFGANTYYQELIVKINKDIDIDKVKENIDEINKIVDNKEIKTLTDLEAFMVVKERLKDARDNIDKAQELFEQGNESLYYDYYAKGIERVYSAESWMNFFGTADKEYEFDKASLKEGCLRKISEAEERYQYAIVYFPTYLESTKEELDYAYEDLENGDHELCLFKASKAKAEADQILGIIGVEESQVQNILSNKLKIVKRLLAGQQEKGEFPILGYSYYEYADSLKEEEPYSALLYAEYALELGNLDLYFKEKNKVNINMIHIDTTPVLIFIIGMIIGMILILLIKRKK